MTIETNFDKDYKALLQLSYHLLEETEKVGNPDGWLWGQSAHNLSIKLVGHLSSVFYLSRGTNLPEIILRGKPIDFPDISSLHVILRTSFENYLTFYSHFVKPESDDEIKFLSNTWGLGGLIQLRKFHSSDIEDIEETLKKNEERIEKVQLWIKKSPQYEKLDKGEKKKAVKGDWRLGNSWVETAKNVGIGEKYFNSLYSMLSSHTHSGFGSMGHFQETPTPEFRQKEAENPVMHGVIILGQFIFSYIKIFPRSDISANHLQAFAKAQEWKNIGDRLFAE